MAGVLKGLKVLDLSWGVAGPMTTMLMGDHGAQVLKIEPPGGDRFADQAGYQVWGRGKAIERIDLKSDEGRVRFLELAADADVVVESFSPGTADRLGVGYEALSSGNRRLIYCSITGYGRDNAYSERKAYDALVAARTGLMWEQRGWPEGAEHHIARKPGFAPDEVVPQDWVQGPVRPGPVFPASRWPSLGAFFAASLGLAAALRVRGLTGRGQLVETSLLRGAIASAWALWQRAADPDAPSFASWVFNARSPKGHFRTEDGRWIHQWAPNPRFIMEAAENGSSPELNVRFDPGRFGIGVEELIAMAHFYEPMADQAAKRDAEFWLEAGRIAGMPLQVCRPVEEALNDPLMLADGCVQEREVPGLGRIREVGSVYRLSRCDPKSPEAASRDIEARAAVAMTRPLQGVRVLDFGMAVAGPYGTQLLSDLGADVIKVGTMADSYWHETSIGYTCNHGKRSIQLNLKEPRAMEIVRRLVAGADIVQHNMRYPAVIKLGVDYESLKAIKADLIYCHTRGHERGPRDGLPGNDQTAASLAGIEHEDGAMAAGGKPMWALTSLGDTGNGFLSAIGIIHALMHRDRTGEGQFVDTSIVYASLLNTSHAFAFPGGGGPERARLDPQQLGFTALYRLYEAADGWICLAVTSQAEWRALCEGLRAPDLAEDRRFSDPAARSANDEALAERLAELVRHRPALELQRLLDAAGAPVEFVDPEFSLKLFDDPVFRERGWTVGFPREGVGNIEMAGVLVDLSETPGGVQGPPLVSGADTRSILESLGYDAIEIGALIADRIVRQA
jgi:crotonobetainyl-CoA:carnitine CoA-transferase CaiB-like acyl-CoA transferase